MCISQIKCACGLRIANKKTINTDSSQIAENLFLTDFRTFQHYMRLTVQKTYCFFLHWRPLYLFANQEIRICQILLEFTKISNIDKIESRLVQNEF